MMNSIKNTVQLIGNVGQDPEINILENGRKYAKFSLATTEKYKNDKGEKVEVTYWHRVCFWNKSADIIEKYVFKGSKVAVHGKLITRSWEDEAGVKHYRTEISGKELLLLHN